MILYYHAIAPRHRERFARQMDILRRYAEPVQTDFDLPLPRGRRFACVTFDDGMVSFANVALPELEKRQIPSTVFVVSGKLGQPPDWRNYSDEPLTTETTMNADQLRGISGHARIGSHTATHPMLTHLEEAEARRELQDSRTTLESLLNEKVTQFSFPYGDFNDTLIKLSLEAGYERVFTTQPSTFKSLVSASVFGRVTVEPTDWDLEFRLKVLGAYTWLPKAFAIKRNIRRLFHKSEGPKTIYDISREHGH